MEKVIKFSIGDCFSASSQDSSQEADETDLSRLNWGVTVMAAWSVVMTVAVAALAIVFYRRWKRHQYPIGSPQSGSLSGSSEDLSDLPSNLGSMMGLDDPAPPSNSGALNSAFQNEGASSDIPEVVVEISDPPNVHAGSSNNSAPSTTSVRL